MRFYIDKFLLLITLILIQSCSGGRIGNFLESSFNNIEESKIKEDIKNNSRNKEVQSSQKQSNYMKNIVEPKIQENIKINIKNNELKNLEKQSKINKKINTTKSRLQKKQYKPQSYKIIFILKDVDPKDPIEDLSIILRNSDVNFEIEKIERFSDSEKKSIKNN